MLQANLHPKCRPERTQSELRVLGVFDPNEMSKAKLARPGRTVTLAANPGKRLLFPNRVEEKTEWYTQRRGKPLEIFQ